MKFGLLSEAHVLRGSTHSVRYSEVVKEAIFAEEMGFDFWGTSEQHMNPSAYTVSAPEVLMGAVAALTSTIKIRPMSVVALGFNHPIRIAERLNTLDIVSKGRLEIGTARANNSNYVNAFGVDLSRTRQEWRETTEAMIRAMRLTPFEFHSDLYDFEPCYVAPRPYSKELPPLFVATTSIESHKNAAELGIGTMTLETWFGWEYLQACLDARNEGAKNASPIGGLYSPNETISFLTFPAHVAATRQQAIDEARTEIQGLLLHVIELYKGVVEAEKARGGSSYRYMEQVVALEKHVDDIDYLIDSSPTILVGTPDDVIERIHKYEELGINEVILRIENYGHHANMRSIEMFGKYVLPAINSAPYIPNDEYQELGIEMEKFRL